MQTAVAIDNLAQIAGVSLSQLYRLFHEHVHETPMQLAQKIRMSYAAALVGRTQQPIREIALRVGYEEPL